MAEFPGNRSGRFDYDTDEHYTGVAWIDGLPIYRRVIALVGGNGLSESAAVEELNSLNRTTIIRVAFATTSPFGGDFLYLAESLQIKDSDGTITAVHTGVDLTGISIHAIVEYTRQQS